MRLIKVENYELTVAPEALLIKPIRILCNADRRRCGARKQGHAAGVVADSHFKIAVAVEVCYGRHGA